MYSLATLLSACLITALVTAVASRLLACRQLARMQEEERQRHELALRTLREVHVMELKDTQASLARDLAALQSRGRRPLRTLVDSLFG